MRGFWITVSAMAVLAAGAATWFAQTDGARRRAAPGPAGQQSRLGYATRVVPPHWVDEQFERKAKPSDDATRSAKALLAAGDIAGAEAECLKAVALSPRITARGVTSPTNAVAINLLGEIYLREGKNREALQTFLGRVPYDVGGGVNVNVAIAYCRLGDYQRARTFLPDRVVEVMFNRTDRRDLPGTANRRTLEASALLIRGANSNGEARPQDALRDFLAAERLVPRNPLAASLVGYVYLYGPPGMQNGEEALPRWRLVASAGHGLLAAQAKKHIEGLAAWFYWHPTPRVQVRMLNNKMVFVKG